MNTLPKYVCHKTVHALKVTAFVETNGATLIPQNGRYGEIKVTAEWMSKHDVKTDGYYVVYEDGYTSWSPVEAFEKGYTLESNLPHVERYVYEVAKCGCRGFFHGNACSDQNVIDPFGSILNPEHRHAVRAMAATHFRQTTQMQESIKSIPSEMIASSISSIQTMLKTLNILADAALAWSYPSMRFTHTDPYKRVYDDPLPAGAPPSPEAMVEIEEPVLYGFGTPPTIDPLEQALKVLVTIKVDGKAEYELGYHTVNDPTHMSKIRRAFGRSVEETCRLLELGIDPSDENAVMKAPPP